MTPVSLQLVLTTFPDAAAARSAAETLVRESLAACVNLLPGVQSVYQWQGQLETSQEVLAIIKTTADRRAAMEHRLRELHPYDLPEIVTLTPSDVAGTYLQWVIDSTRDRG